MSDRTDYAAGVPCWVETLRPDPEPAVAFYGGLFGWTFSEGGPREYRYALVDGLRVAGVAAGPLSWNTYIRVDDVTEARKRAEAAGAMAIATIDRRPAGRLSMLADPTGAPFGIWEAGERRGAQRVNAPGTWTMSSLHTPDPERAAAFFGTVFGWRAETLGALTMFRLPGYDGEPGQPIPPDAVAVMARAVEGMPAHWNVNFRVADTTATVARATELGGAVMGTPVDTPGMRSAVITDPGGAVFSISSVKR
jgi:predicted enzyme related to lactoylglutathione lyase